MIFIDTTENHSSDMHVYVMFSDNISRVDFTLYPQLKKSFLKILK